ncbi:MAG: hypothetical protein LBP26_01295 [Clostridiales bacterium]|jgi:phosphoribosyl 1,2-cyclic phosphate phosphodiesterase|nr:hypothetical protein [Clostridiales bacterium]
MDGAMKIKFLGTAAAEGLPAVFCNCSVCTRAKAAGGKDLRTRSQILIDDSMLIDFPMDTYMHTVANKLDLSRIENVFITHAHMDHCYPMELVLRGAPYAHYMTVPILNVYGNATVIKRIKRQTADELEPAAKKSLALKILKPYDSVRAGRYAVTALPAVHTKGENCFIYLVEKPGTAFMQFNDSGILPDSVYEFLAGRSVKLDAVSFDCTYGYLKKGPGRHMGMLDNAGERERMKKFGIVKDSAKYILTHFSHNGGLLHGELEEKCKESGFIAAYDNFSITI